MLSLLEELRTGKRIVVKHPDYKFTLHAELRMEKLNGEERLTVDLKKVGLPKTAGKGEKLLLKFVNIYCNDAFCNNLVLDILNSKEYKKIAARINAPAK